MGGEVEAIWGGQQQSICCITDFCNVHVLHAGQIWPFCQRCDAFMGVIGKGVQGVLVANKRGGGSVHGGGYDRVTELTTIFQCVTFDALFFGEKVW